MTLTSFLGIELAIVFVAFITMRFVGPRIPSKPYARKRGILNETVQAELEVKLARRAFLDEHPRYKYILPRSILIFVIGLGLAFAFGSSPSASDSLSDVLAIVGVAIQLISLIIFLWIQFKLREPLRSAPRKVMPNR